MLRKESANLYKAILFTHAVTLQVIPGLLPPEWGHEDSRTRFSIVLTENEDVLCGRRYLRRGSSYHNRSSSNGDISRSGLIVDLHNELRWRLLGTVKPLINISR